MTPKENYVLVENQLNKLWNRWMEHEEQYRYATEVEINEFEDARNALENLLIAADKNGK